MSKLSFLKGYIRYGPQKLKVKSHKIFTTTTLHRQMIVQYENIIKCSESKFKNYIFNVFKFKQAILNSM